MAQEVLRTFADSLGEVALVPETGGTFEIRVEGEVVWSFAEQERFPQPKELKQCVRDLAVPDAHLGHAEGKE